MTATRPGEDREWMRNADVVLSVEDLRGRLAALSEGRTFLPNWVSLADVFRVVDEWEPDLTEAVHPTAAGDEDRPIAVDWTKP